MGGKIGLLLKNAAQELVLLSQLKLSVKLSNEACACPVALSINTDYVGAIFCPDQLADVVDFVISIINCFGPAPSTPAAVVEYAQSSSIDDLRRGQFGFYESTDRPAENQIVFSPTDAVDNTMTWRYPHQRRISMIFVTPVPFDVEIVSSESSEDVQLSCVLMYFDDIRQEYLPVYQFSLFQNRTSQYVINASVAASEWQVCFSSFSLVIINIYKYIYIYIYMYA
jgi:hypothetical protein